MDDILKTKIAEKLLLIFWANGYHSTTFQELQRVLDMRPGSIYYNLGNKEYLCKMALELYVERLGSMLLEARLKHKSPIKVLKSFVILLLSDFKLTSPNCLCFLIKTMAEVKDHDSSIFTSAKIGRDSFDKKIESLLEEAKELGEINPVTCCKSKVILIQSFIDGMRIVSKSSMHDVILEELIDDFFDFLFG